MCSKYLTLLVVVLTYCTLVYFEVYIRQTERLSFGKKKGVYDLYMAYI